MRTHAQQRSHCGCACPTPDAIDSRLSSQDLRYGNRRAILRQRSVSLWRWTEVSARWKLHSTVLTLGFSHSRRVALRFLHIDTP